MTRLQLMRSMIELNEKNQNRKLGFWKKAYGVMLMSFQSKKTLASNEFKLRAWVINKED